MQIEELNNFVAIFDIYGKLLSKKQFELFSEFINFNLSETELAESTGATRQSVHDAITKAKKQLLDFEQKCKVAKNKQETKIRLEKLKNQVLETQTKQAIDEIISNL